MILEFIDDGLRELARAATDPQPPLGYGVDLSCVADLAPDLREVAPFSQDALREACLRRLITPRGTVPDSPNYGFDVRALMNSPATPEHIASWRGRIVNELQKDDRVRSVDARVTFEHATTTASIAVAVEPEAPETGGFAFTLVLNADGLAEILS